MATSSTISKISMTRHRALVEDADITHDGIGKKSHKIERQHQADGGIETGRPNNAPPPFIPTLFGEVVNSEQDKKKHG